MLKEPEKDIFTIGIGGAAGDGVKKAGASIGAFLHKLGYEAYLSFNYPSLIRGGHNFARLSFSKEPVSAESYGKAKKIWCDHTELDMLIASNEESVEFHKKELKENAVVITDLPLFKISENPEIIFKDKNLEKSESKGEFIDGNKSFAKGLEAAGLDFYLSYPMTPSTSILHYLASRQKADGLPAQAGLKVIQPENEISAINMALGMAYAGKRVAIGSATGGFALMQEAFSFAGMAELPLVIAVSQRQAPATGVPTRSSQSDLRFVIHAGHGEFPRIVLAPGDSEESFKSGAEALNLAWKFQIPVIVLLDKILSEHVMTSSIDTNSISIEHGKIAENTNENYNRYEITPDGISPMAFPGTSNTVVKITSYEHDEKGATTDEPELVKKMLDKRFNKAASIEAEMQNKETIKIYGDKTSENAVVFFGSTKDPVLEASKYFDKPVKLVQIIWLEPFDKEKILKELNGAKRIINIEANHNGQLASLIREKTGIVATHNILKYDSVPFDPIDLAGEINKILA
jgi:2-oxoglutarate ferredoxin oxidoreductase subunit alpha